MAAVQSQGTSFTFNDGTTAQTVAGIRDYSFSGTTSTEIDITNLASTSKEYSVGLADQGSITLNVISDTSDVGQAAIETARAAGATRECVLTLSDSTTATFDAVCTGFDRSGSVDSVDEATITLKIDGSITWA